MNKITLHGLKQLVGMAVLILVSLLVTTAFAQSDLDLDKAVKVGSGNIMVIEFTDPDCPFCRKAEAYFQKRSDVTRYIFFMPLARHPDSKGKVQYILSARDKAKAMREVTSDDFDMKKLSKITAKGKKLQKEHEEIARANKMTSTPTFVIYGRVVEGFDLKRLEPLLK
ncbi:Thiol:disulfide interchange protein DsbC [Citrifermentans bremense]|nr:MULTISPECIES: DsbC family protein [Geobacteraceae]BCG46073.1 Thiol:disulfide interchange protein DsbC [Citrifermentans bremense]